MTNTLYISAGMYCIFQELGDKLVQLQSERESLNYRVQTSIQNNPLCE